VDLVFLIEDLFGRKVDQKIIKEELMPYILMSVRYAQGIVTLSP
jgi:hypothetical protein